VPDREYTRTYRANNSDALAKTQQLAAALQQLEQLVTQLKTKLSGYASGAGRSSAAAARQAQALTAALQGVQAQAAQTTTALNGMRASAGGVTGGFKNASNSMGGFVTAGLALSALHQVFNSVLEQTKQFADEWKKMAQDSIQFRDSLRELADITGKKGPDNATYADVLDLANETGLIPEKAREFAQSYQNIGPTVREKGHIKPTPGQTVEQLEHGILVETARTARRIGLDEGAAGEAIGTAGMFHAFGSVEQSQEQFGTALWGLSKGKLQYSKGVTALNKAASKLVDNEENRLAAAAEGASLGRYSSYGEAGIMLGTLSLGTGTADQAQHRMIQISRLLNSSPEKGREALKQAGLTDQMTDPEKLIALRKYLDKSKLSAKTFLEENKLGSVATREATEAGLKVTDVLEQRLKEAKEPGASARVMQENAAFYAKDQSQQAQQVKASEDVLNKAQGAEVADYETAKRMAEVRMRLNQPGYQGVGQRVHEWLGTPFSYLLSGESGHELNLVTDEKFGSLAKLRQEAQKVGIDVDKAFPDLESGDYQTRAGAFNRATAAVRQKGGDPLGTVEVKAQLGQQIQEMRSSQLAAEGKADPELIRLTKEQSDKLDGIRQAIASIGNGPGGAAGGVPVGGGPVPPRPTDVPGQGAGRR